MVEFTAVSILGCGTIGGTSRPAFVNAQSAASESTSVHTGALPGGRVNGNLLIFYFKVRSTANDPIVSAGWTAIDTFGFGGSTFRYGAYYCYVTGSETAPTLTWRGDLANRAVRECCAVFPNRSRHEAWLQTQAKHAEIYKN
jgi:hypothetical protein